MSYGPMTLPASGGGFPAQNDENLPLEKDYAGREEWIHADPEKPTAMKMPSAASRTATNSRVRRTILLGLGMLVMFNLLFIPTWNCVGLLRDPVFMFMASSETATWFLGCCIVLLLLCYFTLQMFLNHARREARTEQSLIMISCIFLSTLGITLLLFGGPLKREAQLATGEFITNCKAGARTSQLYIAQEKLQSLRAVPSCAKLVSVEECNHFDAFPQMKEAMVLKFMESAYQCSGLCEGANTQGEQIYPLTLFSKADYKTSCDGMAARRLRNFAEDVSKQTLTQGAWLLVAAIFMSFAQLIGFCGAAGREPDSGKLGHDYGSTL